MMKANVQFDWEYFEAIMEKLGFAQKWISAIMGMVRSVSLSALFNGNKLEGFKTKVLDKMILSHPLFLLVAGGRTFVPFKS
jgi:hypothetical protein